MADDIVERLRRIDLGRMECFRAMEQAADEIERLRAENERLIDNSMSLLAEVDGWKHHFFELQALIDAWARTYPDFIRMVDERHAVTALLAAATKEDDRG